MDWRPWLTRWSEEWIGCTEPDELDPEVVRDGWLGFDPAPPEAVVAAEERLGTRLPPSYREFLLTTDGWRNAGIFVWRMRGTSDLGWVRDLEPYWQDWDEPVEEEEADGGDGPISRGLLISLETDAGILYLDPGDVDENGEWAAYSLFSWRAAPPERFPSFTALMEDLYAEFHRMRRPEGATRDSWAAKVEQARRDALAGDVDGAEAVLAQAENFGHARAAVLRAQILLFLGRTYEAEQLLGRLLHPSFTPDGFLSDPLFTEEFLPLLFVQHGQVSSPHRNSILQMAMGRDPALVVLVAEYQARLRRSEVRPDYGNPEFTELVRAALDRRAGDPDALWRAVGDALPLWRPRSTDHIAPVVLLTEPVLAETLTPERGRALLPRPGGDR
ncbi:SMI1/KNR4 family protein [Actinomadura sp. NPDC047616]|uniref:SMI1/KNR4 family protein n=1 Tax=Actinomadura sp. NPDC047616 TaxID=3155914 RepID=UPI0033EB9E8F